LPRVVNVIFDDGLGPKPRFIYVSSEDSSLENDPKLKIIENLAKYGVSDSDFNNDDESDRDIQFSKGEVNKQDNARQENDRNDFRTNDPVDESFQNMGHYMA